MTSPIALCLERVPTGRSRPATFTRCVAVEAGSRGLEVALDGAILWENDEDVAAVALEVARDGRLAARLCEEPGSPRPVVEIRRAGRALALVAGALVPLLDGDELHIEGGAVFKVHVHGEAPAVAPPELLDLGGEAAPSSSRWQHVAAAAVISAGLMGGPGCDDRAPDPGEEPLDVREAPPVVAPEPDPSPQPDAASPDPLDPTLQGEPKPPDMVTPDLSDVEPPKPPEQAQMPTNTPQTQQGGPTKETLPVRPSPPRMAAPTKPPPSTQVTPSGGGGDEGGGTDQTR